MIFPKTYFDEEESLEDKIQANESIKVVKREKLTQLKRELSICESELKKSRNKLRNIKEECEKGSNESHSAQLNHDKPYQQLKQLEMKKQKEVEKMEDTIKGIKRKICTYRETLQTLRSNRSKFGEPVQLVERIRIPSNHQSAASSVASMGLANSRHSLNQEQSTNNYSLTVQNAVRSEQVPDGNTHAAVSDVNSTLPSLNTNPSSHPRQSTNVSPTQRRNITLPSLQSNVAAIRPSVDSTTTSIQPRPPRPSTGQARSAAPRCHRRRRSLTEPLNLATNDCPSCAQLRLELQRSRQTILRLRLKQQCKLD